MLLPAVSTRDTLNAAALPPTDGTELNYRTRPHSPEEERRFTLRVLSSGILLAAPLGLILSWLLTLTGVFYSVIGAAGIVFWSAPCTPLCGAGARPRTCSSPVSSA